MFSIFDLIENLCEIGLYITVYQNIHHRMQQLVEKTNYVVHYSVSVTQN